VPDFLHATFAFVLKAVEAVHQGRHCPGHIGCGPFKSVLPDGFAVSSRVGRLQKTSVCFLTGGTDRNFSPVAIPTAAAVELC